MKNYNYSTAGELLKLCQKENLKISDIVVRQSVVEKGINETALKEEMHRRLQIIKESIQKGLNNETRSKSGLSGGDAKKLHKYKASHLLLGNTVLKAVEYSFAIMEHNARFGRIVAFPTAGSAGTVPATLIAAGEALGKKEDEIVQAMFTAAGIGIITGQNAMLAGAMGGCQAEVGTASAMASAALTELRGGSCEQCFNAASITLKGMLGLVCDPIAGLVEAPCIKRNATGISNAFMASEITIAGVSSNVSYDEVVVAMANVAKLMALELKETARGGLAITKTGRKIACKMYGTN